MNFENKKKRFEKYENKTENRKLKIRFENKNKV